MEEKRTIEEVLGRRLLLGELIARNSRKFPDKEALVYGEVRLTYKQFNARINQLAHALLDLGIKKGSKVAILSFNCNQFLETYFALGKIGGVAVPLNFRLAGEELVYIINHSDAEALIMGEAFIETAKGLRTDVPEVKHYISISDKTVEGMIKYESLIAKYAEDEPLILVEEDDPLFIMYTAGTTGRPKGAVITHKNEMVMWMLISIFVFSQPGLTDLWNSRVLIPPPVFHLAGWGLSQLGFFTGVTVVLPVEVFDPAAIMKTIEEERITAILLVPAMSFFILQLPDISKYDTSSLQIWVSGAAILPTETRRQIM